jgi:hypothetical protein
VTAAPSETERALLTLRAFGVAVDVRVGGDRAPEVLTRMQELWEFCGVPQALDTRAEVLAVCDTRADVVDRAIAAGDAARTHVGDLLQLVTQRITLAAIDARAGECLMLHAACLADPETGVAAAFVAPGGTGKTTLVRTLGPGRWYVTDETTAVLADRTVVPYPKPLSLRRAPASPSKDETAPRELGLAPPTGPVRLGAVCLLDRTDEHDGPPVVSTLSTLDALVALVPQTSHLPEMHQPLQGLAALCESLGGVHRVTYRESVDLAGWVDELLSGAV